MVVFFSRSGMDGCRHHVDQVRFNLAETRSPADLGPTHIGRHCACNEHLFLRVFKNCPKEYSAYLYIGGRTYLPVCFSEWKSYPLVLVMIALGIYLRAYSPIPKSLLAVLYLGIGGGLSSSSLRYFIQMTEL